MVAIALPVETAAAAEILMEGRPAAQIGRGRIHGLSYGLLAHLIPTLTIMEQLEAAQQPALVIITIESTLNGLLNIKVGQIDVVAILFHSLLQYLPLAAE